MPTTPFVEAKERLLAEADSLNQAIARGAEPGAPITLSNRKLDKAAKKVLLLGAGRRLGSGEGTTLTYADPTPAEAIRNILREAVA